MQLFRLNKKYLEKRKDLEGIIFIETEDHGLLLTDQKAEDFWEIDYDILKEEPRKIDEYRIENYPLSSFSCLSDAERELVERINSFIEDYHPFFCKPHTFEGIKVPGFDLKKLPSAEMLGNKKKELSDYVKKFSESSTEEISARQLRKLLDSNKKRGYRLTNMDGNGNIIPLSEEEIINSNELFESKINTIKEYIPDKEKPPKGLEGFAGISGLKEIASQLKNADLRKCYSNSSKAMKKSGWMDKIKRVIDYGANHEIKLPKINRNYLKPATKVAAAGIISLSLLLGSFQTGRWYERRSTIQATAPPIELVQNAAANQINENNEMNEKNEKNEKNNLPQYAVSKKEGNTQQGSEQTAELMENFRTSMIGPTSSILYPLRDVSAENGMLSFDVPVRGNASEAFAYFGNRITADVYRAEIINGIASFTMPASESRAGSKEKLNVIAGHYGSRGAQWTSSWRFNVDSIDMGGNDRKTPSYHTQEAEQETGKIPESKSLDDITEEAEENQENQQSYYLTEKAAESSAESPMGFPAESREKDHKIKTAEYIETDSAEIKIAQNEKTSEKEEKYPGPAVDENIAGDYVLLINKHYQKASLYRVDGTGNPHFVTAYHVSTGRNPGDKQRAGDNKTPEGRFRITEVADTSDWLWEGEKAYGSWGFRLDCGSWDSRGNHNPYGKCPILMHGTPTDEPYANKYWGKIGQPASHGCIRFYEDDIRELKEKYIVKGTTVLVYDSPESASSKVREIAGS